MSRKNPQPARPKTKTAAKPVKTAKSALIRTPLPVDNPQIRRLWADVRWFVMAVAAIYLMLLLAGFNMLDPAWSRSVPKQGDIHNPAGLLGAYLADIFYYLFGFSAWWLLSATVAWLYRNTRRFSGQARYQGWVAGLGLGLLLFASPVLETLSAGKTLDDSLPIGAGGLVGSLVASGLRHVLGLAGSVGLSVMLVFVGLSLLLQVSPMDVSENIGRACEYVFRKLFVRNKAAAAMQPEKPRAKPQRSGAEEIVAEPVTPVAGSKSNRKMSVQVAQPQVPVAPPKPQPQEVGEYCLPDIGSLKTPEAGPASIDPAKLERTALSIEAKLAEFGIQVQVVSATAGPVITRYEIEPAQGVKGSQIVNLAKDLARSLRVQSVRVVETIPGRSTMGIELPNEERQEVLLQEIFTSPVFTDAQSKLTVALGKDIAGVPVVGDLAKMPHLLVGGMTGSGKSVGVNAMIMSMLYKARPDEVRFIMIDPKMLELSVYEGIPHLLCPVVTDMKAAGNALNWCVAEMEKRYRLLSHVGVRNLAGYNEKIAAARAAEKPLSNPFTLTPDDPEPLEELPQIVVVIDELADLMMTEKKAVETQIARLAQKARAAGIHMIIATQRPSVDVITGLIKANVPTRMAFTVQSRIDSRTILDQMGAEDLLKYGDLLFLQPGNAEPTRLQGAFVSDDEVHRVVSFIKEQAEPNYVEGILSGEAAGETNSFINPEAAGSGGDELFDQAVAFIASSRKTSISSLQRHLRIGYNRAANLMQALEDGGIVSPPDAGGARQILVRQE